MIYLCGYCQRKKRGRSFATLRELIRHLMSHDGWMRETLAHMPMAKQLMAEK